MKSYLPCAATCCFVRWQIITNIHLHKKVEEYECSWTLQEYLCMCVFVCLHFFFPIIRFVVSPNSVAFEWLCTAMLLCRSEYTLCIVTQGCRIALGEFYLARAPYCKSKQYFNLSVFSLSTKCNYFHCMLLLHAILFSF